MIHTVENQSHLSKQVNQMVEPWRTLEREQVATVEPLFELHRVTRKPPEGRQGQFYVAEAPDWINVVVIDERGQFVLVRQYRHGSDRISLEVPAGAMESPDSSPLETAKREVREETGYTAPDWEKIGSVEPNPAFLSNVAHIFLAIGARKTAQTSPDEFEALETVKLSEESFLEQIDANQITHSLTVTAAHFYLRRKNS